MNKYLFLGVFLFFSSICHSDGAIREAEKLLELSGTKEVMEQMTDMVLAQELQNNPTLVPFENVMRQFFQKYLSYESTKDEMVSLYVEVFSKEELSELNAFYSTKLGQKAVKTMPGLMQKGGEMGTQRVQDNLAELQQMIADEAERLKQLSEQ